MENVSGHHLMSRYTKCAISKHVKLLSHKKGNRNPEVPIHFLLHEKEFNCH